MGGGKLKMELIANEKIRKKTYKQRSNTLKKNIYEFSKLCSVDACMILYGPNQGSTSCPNQPEIWPQSLDEVHRIAKRYLEIPNEEHDKRNSNLSGFLNEKKEKTHEYELPMLGEVVDKPEYFKWDDQVNGFSIDQLKQLHNTLGSKIGTLGEKIQSMDGEAGMSHEASQKDYPLMIFNNDSDPYC
ncbi:hypothetical protein MKX01_038532 [Papaver californicum]|nr:hypothetical protein MKX01_038532 [Papaver californicum]